MLLRVPCVAASGLNSTSRPLEKHNSHYITSLPYSRSDYRVNCTGITYWDGGRETWPGGTETYCWSDVSITYKAPLATSVACNSVTYVLHQPHGWDHVTEYETGTAVIKQVFAPTDSDLEYASTSWLWELEGVPRGI